ncbi:MULTISPECIES: cytochrome b N-terminal domain-containing protein [unclassified Wenzhouxiangella]|uniref:cytochrome b N-terminal domain-containing protein n=1 Tax=unclassified Wenzhouxiangella TaxID=2613841 RepID=UPI000E32C664|nr:MULTISPECIES: cytochrome b N-terminal domain-containing protein [unclassified Wenzhouxiangella]RFF27373.1 hydrogenase iron-sulfur subunit [Wenzhouxiangella sp. 15181]RFP68801.1 hydrogenase iron-sulfur subunit [Wenzhouxiangella sp. 15190]
MSSAQARPRPVWPARALARGESVLSNAFGGAANPFHHLGALAIYCLYIALVTGIYLFVFYSTNLEGAWRSVEAITHEQWIIGGVMRSLHRYSSDAAVLLLALHMLRELVRLRHTGARWFSWLTGMPLIWIVLIFGISGYWMVWDQLAAWVATASARLLDWLPIFSDPMGSSFVSNKTVSGRLFTLIGFIHLVGLPIILVLGIWFHLLRVRYPRIHPTRKLMLGSLAGLLVLSLVVPVTSHAPADLEAVPGVLAIDWFYLAVFPLQSLSSPGTIWLAGTGGTLLLAALPWILPRRRQPVAEVHLPDCTGCGFCAEDCPYGAIDMVPRTDGRNFELEARVNASLCVSCGICTGSCPSSSPFRQRTPLTTGIEMPHFTMDDFRNELDRARDSELTGDRILVFGCDHGVDVEKAEIGTAHSMVLPCVGLLPPPGIDYALRNSGYAGVAVAGCADCDCHHRLGERWTQERIERERQPGLRKRVPRERLFTFWAKPGQEKDLSLRLEAFSAGLDKASAPEAPRLAIRRTGT